MTWINIKEQNPQQKEIVYVLINNGIPSVAKYSYDSFTENGLEVENVTHWMSIPIIPEKGKEIFNRSNYY